MRPQFAFQYGLLVGTETQITDAGWEHLKGLSKLDAVNLSGTEVTYDGVGELEQSVPNCKIWL